MNTLKVQFNYMTMVDNIQGFGGGMAVRKGSPEEYEDRIVELSDNHVYGEYGASDCPSDGSFCKPYDKYGVVMA